MTRVGIVGGGITGLALHHHLAERGVESVVLEAADEPGGVIHSTREDGRVLEHGPQRLRLAPPVADLIDAVGLGGDVIEADDDLPLYVYADGALRRVPMSPRAFLATDLLSWRGKARVLAEPLTATGRPDETAAELFSRKFGREAYENLIGPLFGGIYASDPAEMPARHALSRLVALEEREGSLLRAAIGRMRKRGGPPPAASFEDGMQALPEALADAGEDVRLATPVGAIRDAGGGFALETGGGGVAVDEVVVTAPAPEAADLLAGVADGADALRELRYNPLAVVHLVSDADATGFGYQVRADEGLDTLGVSWNASLFGRDGVYTCFLGGMRNPDLVDRSADELGDVAREEFEAVMGAGAEVANVTRLERGFPAWDRSWDALDRLETPDGVHLATNYTARMGIPSRIREAKTLAERLATG